MTIDEFIEKLAETPGPWELDAYGVLWHLEPRQCSICAAEGSQRWRLDALSGGAAMGLKMDDIMRIAKANDCEIAHDPDLRARLLAVTVDRPASQEGREA